MSPDNDIGSLMMMNEIGFPSYFSIPKKKPPFEILMNTINPHPFRPYPTLTLSPLLSLQITRHSGTYGFGKINCCAL